MVGFNCSASPARPSWKAPALSRDITPVGGRFIFSPLKVLDTTKPTPGCTARYRGQNTWLHFTRDIDRWESALKIPTRAQRHLENLLALPRETWSGGMTQ